MPLEQNVEADADLATVLGGFTNYIMNERIRAYNEGLDAERERCAAIAEAIDSGRGNEKLIADAIRAPEMSPLGDGKPKRHTVSGSDAADDDDL